MKFEYQKSVIYSPFSGIESITLTVIPMLAALTHPINDPPNKNTVRSNILTLFRSRRELVQIFYRMRKRVACTDMSHVRTQNEFCISAAPRFIGARRCDALHRNINSEIHRYSVRTRLVRLLKNRGKHSIHLSCAPMPILLLPFRNLINTFGRQKQKRNKFCYSAAINKINCNRTSRP